MNLAKRVRLLHLPQGSKVLDFGCGTGLFANMFVGMGLKYYGYDIDGQLISYGQWLYKHCQFTVSKNELRKEAPFDLIIANCCFHHIDDATLGEELRELKMLLNTKGTLFVIDILSSHGDTFLLRKLFRKLELGKHLRLVSDYKEMIGHHFEIRKSDVGRSHLFSMKHNPIYNDMAFFECKIAPPGEGG